MNFGKHGDSKIRNMGGKPAHVNHSEANLLDSVGKPAEYVVKQQGAGTTNPITGMKQYHIAGSPTWPGNTNTDAEWKDHQSANGGTHSHTQGWNDPNNNVGYDYIRYKDSSGNQFDSNVWMHGGSSEMYNYDPHLVENIDHEKWNAHWKQSGRTNYGGWPSTTGDIQAESAEEAFNTIQLLYDTGDIYTLANNQYGANQSKVDQFVNSGPWTGTTPESNPFLGLIEQKELDINELADIRDMDISDAETALGANRRDIVFGLGQDAETLNKLYESQALESGYAMGGGFMKDIRSQKQNLLKDSGLDEIFNTYNQAVSTAKATYDTGLEDIMTIFDEDMLNTKDEVLEQWEIEMGQLG